MEVKILENVQKNSVFHTVKKNQTLIEIAKMYNVSTELIKQNNTQFNNLEIGDVLFIPFTNVAIHIVKPLEKLCDIAKKYNVTEEYIKKKNDLNEIFIGLKLYI